MRILFSTGALYGLPLPWALRLAAQAGCDGVELVMDPFVVLMGPRRVGMLSARAGVPIEAIHPPLFDLPGWNRQPEAFRRLAEWAEALHCPLLVVHPPRMGDLPKWVSAFDRGIQALREVTKGAVQLTVENLAVFDLADRRHPYVLPERVAEFAGKRGLGMTLDTTHVASADLPLVETYEAVAALVKHVHLSDIVQPCSLLDRPSLDTYVKHHQLPGAGHLPLRLFLRKLRESGYGGAITLELSPVALQVWRFGEPLPRLRQSVAYVREELSTSAGVAVMEKARTTVSGA